MLDPYHSREHSAQDGARLVCCLRKNWETVKADEVCRFLMGKLLEFPPKPFYPNRNRKPKEKEIEGIKEQYRGLPVVGSSKFPGGEGAFFFPSLRVA